MEWQPIETAPKDGTRLILYGKKKVSSFIRTQDKPSGFWGYEITPNSSVFESYFSYGRWQISEFGSAMPTHWMPLPPAPEDTP